MPAKYRKAYSTGYTEYAIIEAAARVADEGAFIVPQMSAPFCFSGCGKYGWLTEGRAREFEQKTGISLEFNKGIDTAEWHGVSPTCEIVCCDFTARTGQLSFAE